jgi:hypothetical protein
VPVTFDLQRIFPDSGVPYVFLAKAASEFDDADGLIGCSNAIRKLVEFSDLDRRASSRVSPTRRSRESADECSLCPRQQAVDMPRNKFVAGASLLFQAFAIKDLDLPAAGMNEPGRLEARRDR